MFQILAFTASLATLPILPSAPIALGAPSAAAPSAAGGEHCKAAEHLVVHEWGTFTSVQGSDGVALEGLQHEEESLPDFVYSRSKVRECPLREAGYKGLEVDVAGATKKMETPILYFHSPVSHRLRLRVRFEGGLLSQWFPVSDLLGPPEGPRDPEGRSKGPLDLAKIDASFLEWDFDVLAPGEGMNNLPAVEERSPWWWQRHPQANVVRTLPRKAPRSGPVESEKFLFYRGLGHFDLPLTVKTEAGAKLTIQNGGKSDVPALFVLNVQHGLGEFTFVNGLASGAEVRVARPLSAGARTVDEMVRALRPALAAKLVERGLFPDEAEAMVRTWERSYFRTEGLRVLYVVPDDATAALLPLSIDPPPRSLVRVLVGRMECITPEAEAEVRQALLGRTSSDIAVRAAAEARLARLGRFLEPHLRRALALSGDERLTASAKELVAGL